MYMHKLRQFWRHFEPSSMQTLLRHHVIERGNAYVMIRARRLALR